MLGIVERSARRNQAEADVRIIGDDGLFRYRFPMRSGRAEHCKEVWLDERLVFLFVNILILREREGEPVSIQDR